MKNFEELFAEYEKQVNEYSSGLVKAEKAEFMKIVLAYKLLRGNELQNFKKEWRSNYGKSHS